MIRTLYNRKSFKVCLTTIFFIILLLGCYSRNTLVGQNSTPNQRDPNRNISKKDIQRFVSSIKIIDGNLDAKYKQALYFQQKKKHKIALTLLKEVIKKDPSYDKAYNAMGMSYDYLGNYNNATQCYELALKINPGLDYVHNNLGYSHLLNGNLDHAIDAFQKAITLNGNNKRYHNNLGLAYAQKGQFDLALEQFMLAGDEISANRKLSQFFYREGKHELARKYRQKAIQLEAANHDENSIVASNKNHYSDYDSKVEENSLKPTNSDNALKANQNYFQAETKAVSADITQFDTQKKDGDNSGQDSIRDQMTRRKPIEKVPDVPIADDKRKKKFAKTDPNNEKHESLKRPIENQRIKSTQYSAEPEIEVSNGNGVNSMATRVGNYLINKGLNIILHTNADHFGYKESKIYYSEPYLHEAYKVAQQIPGWQNMEKADHFNRPSIKIKVLIGHDLISYDGLFSENMEGVSFHPYSILVASCRMRESVRKVLLDYNKIGLAPYVVKVELGSNEIWWRIFLGHYKSRGEALKTIKEYDLSNSIVIKTPYTTLIGNYSSEDKATERLQSIKESGYSPYIVKPGKNNFQLVVGAFKKRKDAEKQKIDLLSAGIKNQVIRR